ncbi:exosortase C-terminal domain/associated protein EpsI [Schlesneria sp. T3-172]|uniref:exosortase C-terminal domain/associated protein EpsI n=1 Tax=Schlesneria sphaerica TaxID=3373610 RepID=UPI0037C95167
MMNQFSSRIWLAALLMVGGFVGTWWVRSGYTFEVQPLSRGLETFPIELDGYVGTDLPVDEDVAIILNADSSINRNYKNPNGNSVILHASAWVRPETVASVAPHSPKICYTNAGWRIVTERTVQCTAPSGSWPMCVLLLDRDGERCVVGYWYQIGHATFNTASEARSVHRDLWGKKKWPATIKFMLQTPGHDLDVVLPTLEEFAKNVYQWSTEL